MTAKNKLITHEIADDLEILEWDATAYDEPFDIAIRTASSALLSLKITLTPAQTAMLGEIATAAAQRFNVELNVDTETGDLFDSDKAEHCLCPLPLMEPLCPVHGHSFGLFSAAEIAKHCVCPRPLLHGDCPIHGGTPTAEIARAAISEPAAAHDDAMTRGPFADTSEDS